MDGTLATFTLKFWKQISYGSVNWGVLPLISDLKGLYASASDVFFQHDALIKEFEKGSHNISYHWEWQRSYPRASPMKSYDVFFKGTVRLSGRRVVTPPPVDDFLGFLYFMLDELGVHPDLKTVWDIVPLSFVADYFLPIGDSLEAIHPRGWYHPTAYFSGGLTISGETVTLNIPLSEYRPGGVRARHNVYRRVYGVNNILPTRPPMKIQWQSPNARELFNTAYLARGRFGK